MLGIQEDMSNICRICLQEVKVKDATNLFSEVIESKNIFKIIELCFQIILDCKTSLPSIICSYCMNELNIANSFRIKCLSSEEKILSHHRQLSKNNIQETGKEVVILKINEDSIIGFKDIPIKGSNINKIDNEVKDKLEDNVENTFSEGNNSESDDAEKIIDTYDFSNQHTAIKTQTACKRVSFKCYYCDKNFETRILLKQHKVSMHERHQLNVIIKTGFGATRRYHCKLCSYSSPYSQSLIIHVNRHTGEKPYVCSECGKRFPDFSCLNTHRRTHSNTTYFVCSKCGKQLKTGSCLRQHSRFHEESKYCCDICKKVYKSKHTLRDHILRHNNIRNFSCEDCGRTFVASSGLIHHKQIHKRNERNVECDLSSFKTQRRRRRLDRESHSDDRPYECELCDKTFYTKQAVQRHQRVHVAGKRRKLNARLQSHNEDRPHKCKLCDKTFYTRQGVQSHHRVHAAEKEFQCPSCPKAYTRRRSLLRHLKGKHDTDCYPNNLKITKKCMKTKDDIANDEPTKKSELPVEKSL